MLSLAVEAVVPRSRLLGLGGAKIVPVAPPLRNRRGEALVPLSQRLQAGIDESALAVGVAEALDRGKDQNGDDRPHSGEGEPPKQGAPPGAPLVAAAHRGERGFRAAGQRGAP